MLIVNCVLKSLNMLKLDQVAEEQLDSISSQVQRTTLLFFIVEGAVYITFGILLFIEGVRIIYYLKNNFMQFYKHYGKKMWLATFFLSIPQVV